MSTSLTYKTFGDLPIELDIYHPSKPSSASIAAVIYFHFGGFVVGSRKTAPQWMIKRVLDAGFAFVSADHRLLPAATGHDVLNDIKDVFAFVAATEFENTVIGAKYRVDSNNIFAAGSSSGGWCAYLSIYASPKPKAIVSFYGMGGKVFTSNYLVPKTAPFFRGMPLDDPEDPQFRPFLFPDSQSVPYLSSYALFPRDPHNAMAALYLQLAVFLDYYTGEHIERINSAASVPDKHKILFPELGVSADWPPTYFVHGTDDRMVLPEESENLYRLLKEFGVETQLIAVDGVDHVFDMGPDAESQHQKLFDDVAQFLKAHVE